MEKQLRKVLIIEDDQAIRETLAEILNIENYEVSVAGNGQQALDQLGTEILPHLILLDLMMPVMDGFTFRQEQLKNPVWSKIPVIIMSADGHLNEKLAQIGGVAYMRKPPDLEALIDAVGKYGSLSK